VTVNKIHQQIDTNFASIWRTNFRLTPT